MERTSQKLKEFQAVITGGTGAVGRELIKHLIALDSCNKIFVFARRNLEEWSTEAYTSKLDIIECETLDSMDEHSHKFKNAIFYSCLGAKMNIKKEKYTQIEYQYPLDLANIALKEEAKGFFYVSGNMANHKSWNFHCKTKGL